MPTDSEDVMLWPDDSWCFRYELEEFLKGKSDDYETLYIGTLTYQSFMRYQES